MRSTLPEIHELLRRSSAVLSDRAFVLGRSGELGIRVHVLGVAAVEELREAALAVFDRRARQGVFPLLLVTVTASVVVPSRAPSSDA